MHVDKVANEAQIHDGSRAAAVMRFDDGLQMRGRSLMNDLTTGKFLNDVIGAAWWLAAKERSLAATHIEKYH